MCDFVEPRLDVKSNAHKRAAAADAAAAGATAAAHARRIHVLRDIGLILGLDDTVVGDCVEIEDVYVLPDFETLCRQMIQN